MTLFRMTIVLAAVSASLAPAMAQTVSDWPIQSDPFAEQQATRIEVGQDLPRRELLTPGVRRYLRYTVKDDHHSALDIWTRRIEQVEVDGSAVLRMTMNWDQATSPGQPGRRITQTATFDDATLAPMSHHRRIIREDEVLATAFRYEDGVVLSTVEEGPSDEAASAPVPMPVPAYNFEYDMELFQTLDWSTHPVVDLVFYDPGYDPPASYRFGVVGEDSRMGANGELIDCWVIASDYNSGEFNKRMWIAKGSQLVIYEEAVWNGVTYIKTLIGVEAAQ